jgi:glycosyltransferase involved in cell wall biosynthesis
VNPRISIVTPSYNQAKFIQATIESVLSQDYPDVEYAVIDGGSQDDTVQILESYGPKLQWISEPDQGQAGAVNKGFQRSYGEILGWLNADDLYYPGTLRHVAHQFENDPDLMMLYGDANHIDVEGKTIDQYPTAEYRWENLAFHCFVCQPACFFRRLLIENVGYLDPRLRYALDLDLWIRFGLAQRRNPTWKLQYVPRLFASSRMHRENKTLSKRTESLREIIQVVRKHFGYVPPNWIYRLEEAADRQYDGYFQRSPLSFPLLFRSVFKWARMNRDRPSFVLKFVGKCMLSPRRSFYRLVEGTRNAQANPKTR